MPLLKYIKKWIWPQSLDIILSLATLPSVALRTRIEWYLINWLRTAGIHLSKIHTQSNRILNTRLKYFLQVLDHNTHLKKLVAKTLRSIIRDTHGLRGELISRLSLRT